MAGGHVSRTSKAEHMAAPTKAAANVKNALANSEPHLFLDVFPRGAVLRNSPEAAYPRAIEEII